jgi:hypothetical protein
MTESVAIRIPPRLLVLDAIGTLLLALGIAEQFTELQLWPLALQFPGDGIAIMAAGVLMMLPLFTFMFRQVAGQLRTQRQQS